MSGCPGWARVSAVVLLRDDGAALLQHRDDKPGLSHAGMWVMPGGHAEPGEDSEGCARREFLEETDYVCDGLWPLVCLPVEVEGAPVRFTVYWTRYDGRQRPTCLEGQALEFVERQRAETLAMPSYLVDVWDLALRVASGEPSPE